MSNHDRHFYQFGPFQLDPLKRRLLRDGNVVPLTPKAYDTLFALVRQSGKTIEKDDLMKEVWPDAVVEENNLNQNITALRKSLGDKRQDSQYIATIPGLGYRFVAEVQQVDVSTDVEEVAKNLAEGLSTHGLEEVGGARDKRAGASLILTKTKRARLLLLLLAVVLVSVAVYAWTRERQVPPPVTITSIAVLPLENLSDNPSEEYFADGMTDALIGDLAKIGELRVISRTSSMQYKRTKKSLPEIARELKIDALVEGTVQRVGDRVQVRAQLIYAPTDQHLWVKTYERDMRDVLALQSEIAQEIAREVHIKISPEQQARLTPRRDINPKAFDAYLQGRYLFWNKRTEENLNKAIEFFQKAIQEDPTYALAYAALADCHVALGTVQFGALPPIEARRRAEAAAAEALKLDSELAEAHSALGAVNHYNWNWSVAEQELKRAIELNPSYASAHIAYASYLMSLGRIEESIAASNRAMELDPLSLSLATQRGFLLEDARRYNEAIEQLNRVIAVDQNHYQALWMLGHTYAVNGQLEQAITAAEKAVELSDRVPGALGMLGMIYGLAGRRVEANQILQELLELTKRRYVTPAAVAYVYIGLGDKEQSFVWLEKAFAERSNFIAYLKVVPIVDSIRSDPRFANLVRRVGLPQ